MRPSLKNRKAPARVGADDAVPDVTPDVIAAPGGALVTWSRFDGLGYRVALARFDGERFDRLAAEGPPGSLFPTFVPGGEHPRLLWWDASADLWIAAELTEPASWWHAPTPKVLPTCARP